MSEEERIRELYREYWRCMIGKDMEGLRNMMAADYHLYHMTGLKQDAEEFLRGLMDGAFNYYSAEHDLIEVSINGEEAHMTGRSRVLASVYGGAERTWRLQGDFTLIKKDDDWRFVSSRASVY